MDVRWTFKECLLLLFTCYEYVKDVSSLMDKLETMKTEVGYLLLDIYILMLDLCSDPIQFALNFGE